MGSWIFWYSIVGLAIGTAVFLGIKIIGTATHKNLPMLFSIVTIGVIWPLVLYSFIMSIVFGINEKHDLLFKFNEVLKKVTNKLEKWESKTPSQ